MNTSELASVSRRRFPGKSDAIVSFFGPMFEWDVSLRPCLPDLRETAKRAVFWDRIDDVLALDPGDVSVPGPAQETVASALANGFRDSITNVFHDKRVATHSDAHDLEEMSHLLDALFKRTREQLKLVLGLAFGEIDPEVIDTIQNSIVSAQVIVSMCAFNSILADKPQGAEALKPFLQIFFAGNLPLGIDDVTRTLVVLVGERPTVVL